MWSFYVEAQYEDRMRSGCHRGNVFLFQGGRRFVMRIVLNSLSMQREGVIGADVCMIVEEQRNGYMCVCV